MTEPECQQCMEKWGQEPQGWADSVAELEAYREHLREHVPPTPMQAVVRSLDAFRYAARRAAYGATKMCRPLKRLHDTPGDRHMDAVCRSILRGEPGYTTSDPEIRLHAAVAFAEVLNRSKP